MKKSLSLVLTLVLASQLTACTDEEIATTLGAAAIVAGAIVIDNNTRCVGGYREVCHDYVDYWGNVRYECSEVYESCMYREIKREDLLSIPNAELTAKDIDTASVSLEANVNSVKWGEAFGASFSGSAQFIDALKVARDQKSLQGLESLGLEKKDIKRIAKGSLPTQEGIEALAKSLNQSPQSTKAMLTQLVEKAKELKKN